MRADTLTVQYTGGVDLPGRLSADAITNREELAENQRKMKEEQITALGREHHLGGSITQYSSVGFK